ncbi:Fumarylacetoacetase [Fulvia fulva]|uniref:Fumarylacetoacetase n=1 Tax=Passalora fulva TaxID=5499 RepID=A0A9Q8PAL7_PASFU|nr:Fumarylacetoacetase [Fulvia fulva]KAK4621311.1 Fumarylacetoacetase [Fulvia fulva]KAK4622702.1 Fumarylacetoacetase [Fulvia fulva]UJO18952.1 Fumarylacetoacetase [Fulvia fulva]WPV16639.1 Fumarylacetoacetase [Fulvia fulva]WPV31066.1 Fumarylacetoacetase [Fulvia fulva]
MAPKSWLPLADNSPFSLANIPFGIVTSPRTGVPTPAIAIGEYVLELGKFASNDGFSRASSLAPHLSVFQQTTLNAFAALGRPVHRQVRQYLQDIFAENTPYPEILRDQKTLQEQCLTPLNEVTMHLPLTIGDYSDFYGGMNHAVNAGALFRGQAGALLPNYLHMPIAYHGRASSIVVSGTPVRRPWGQILDNSVTDRKATLFVPCRAMDYELEIGAFICRSNNIGDNISIKDAEDGLFGFVLMNDWSARDIQRWEYVPLRTFNGKNFATQISGWVVLADAMAPFRSKGLRNTQELLPYLRDREDSVYDLNLAVDIISRDQSTTVSQTNAKDGLVWSFPQMLAHQTITGCPMKTGDLLGSGTISGEKEGSLGCLLEMTMNGQKELVLGNGEKRAWLQDGDSVRLRGWAGTPESGLVGFGDCLGQLIAAHEYEALDLP